MTMKKLFSGLFAVLGSVLMVCAVVLCLVSLNAQPKILEFPSAAQQRAQAFAEAVNRGDLEAAGQQLYGQPDLTANADWEDENKTLIWQTYLASLSCTPAQKPEATDAGITWTVQWKMLDLNGLMDSWQEQAKTRMPSEQETGEDEETASPEESVREAVNQGLRQAIQAGTNTITQEGKLNLIYRDGQWWINPDQALLQLLCGQV